MSDLMLARPDNIRGRFGTYVTSDVFHIAERLQELDKRLYVTALDEPIDFHGHKYNFTISEMCGDGVERLVMRTEHLDARVVQACERMLRVPLDKRLDELEKVEDKWAAEEKDRQLEELYERMGGDMWIQLERCGFIDRQQSFAKRNPTARRHRSAKGLVGA